jgi:hypothetical protein
MFLSFTDYAIYQTHCQRCDAVLAEFHAGRMSVPEVTDQLRRLGFTDGEIRTEIEMHERHV